MARAGAGGPQRGGTFQGLAVRGRTAPWVNASSLAEGEHQGCGLARRQSKLKADQRPGKGLLYVL